MFPDNKDESVTVVDNMPSVVAEAVAGTAAYTMDKSVLRQTVSIDLRVHDDRLGKEWPLPEYATPGSAGCDLRAMLDENIVIMPGEVKLIKTGIAVDIQSPEWCFKLYPRSGNGHKRGLVLGNLTGIIDSDYQGEVMVSLWNRGTVAQKIVPGDKIAQMVLTPVVTANFNVVEEFQSKTERGSGGFGSSGQR